MVETCKRLAAPQADTKWGFQQAHVEEALRSSHESSWGPGGALLKANKVAGRHAALYLLDVLEDLRALAPGGTSAQAFNQASLVCL